LLLELYDRNHKKLANLTGIKSPHIQRTLEYGDETLDFSYPTSGPWLAQLLAECYIRTDRQEYVVKAVEKSSTSAWRKVSCALNIEELEGAPFEGFETVEQTVQAAAEFALEGTGWTVETDADITKKRTIRKEDDTTVWEVVKQIVTTYRLELEIDAVNKRLKFHTRRGRDRGAYFIERLNLRSLGVKTSSYGFYTRLIPIGKDGLHLWRDGRNYIENHQYSDKVITSIWRDERYTVTAALLEDAQARLDEASTPARAYTAELVDLAAQSDKYNALAYDLGDAVLLVSEKTDEREKQRIVKLDEYPDDPLANKAELSNVKQTFAQLQKTEAEMATADAVAIATKRTKKVLKDDYLTKEETEVKISALAESIELEVSKTYMTVANGQAAIDKALEAGKQYTDGKLTEYSTTEETKSLITQSAEQITLEVSKTYATTASVEKSLDTLQAAAKSAQETADKANNDAADAQAAADKAAADAAAAAAEADKAKQAAADAETNAAADAQEKANAAQAAAEKAAAADAQAKAAAAEAAAKKAAAEDATAKANAAQEAANKYTDTQLTKYSTTEEMKSAINQSATGITLEVSKTYATKTSVEESVATLQAAAKSAQETADKANNDAADAQAAADKAAADAAAAAAEADKAKQAAADAETNAAADAQEKANAAQAAAEKAAAADAQAKAAAAEAAAKQAAAADAKKKADAAKKEAQDYTDGKLTEYSTTDEMKSAINQTATQISLEVSAQLSGRNLLRYQKFEDKKAGDWHTTVTGDVLTASFFASETAKFYVKEEADAALCELARGRCLTVSGYYKVVKPFQSAAIRLSASWTYTSGTSQSLHYVQNAVFKTDEVSADWIYYEKSYTSELLDEPIKYLGMLCEITPSKAGTDGQIQWKDWTLKISTPVQNGTVRSKFAMDASSATIDTGRLTFNSNTIVINSTNFKLDAYGNVTAKGAFESGDEQSGGYACIKNGTLELKYNGDTNLYFTTTASGSSYANMHLCGPGGQDAITLQARQNEGSGIFLFDKDANQKAYIMGNGAAKFGGGVGIGGDLTLPEDYNHVLYMRRSKLQPCNGRNSLYCDWVNVRGTDGNSYWVLAGFGSYRGS
jgi:phage minor structural protein